MSLMNAEVPAFFRDLARDIDDVESPVEVALGVERAFDPGADFDGPRQRIRSMARDLTEGLHGDDDPRRRFRALGAYLGGDLHFRGDRSEFAKPENSFLTQVLTRRRGLPITLSAIYIAVGRLAAIPVVGIGLPGHFVVGRLDLPEPAFLDPFRGGRAFVREACDRIVREVTGGEIVSADRYLRPTPARRFLARLLTNLQMVFWHRRDNVRGLLAARMLCLVEPSAAEPIKARAYFYDRLGNASSALVDYEAYLRRCSPRATESRRLRRRIRHLRNVLQEMRRSGHSS